MNRSLALRFIANYQEMEEWGNLDCKNVQNFGQVAAGRMTWANSVQFCCTYEVTLNVSELI